MKELKTELIDARNKSRELALRNERARNYSYDVYTRRETKSIIYAVIFMIALMIVLGKFSSISTDRLEKTNFSIRTETPAAYTEIHRYDYGTAYDNGNIIVTSDGNEWELEDVKIPTNAEVKVKFYTNLTESIYDDEIRDVEVIER